MTSPPPSLVAAEEPPPIADRTRDPWWELTRLVTLVLAGIVAARTVGRLDQVLDLVLLAAVVSLLTAPVRNRLARMGPGGLATAVTALATFGGVLVLAALVMRGIAFGADRLERDLLHVLDGLRPGTLPARVAESVDARAGIEEVFGRLPSVLVTGEINGVGMGRRVIELLLVVILAAFLQASGPSLLDRAVSVWPRSARAEVRSLVGDVIGRGGGYVRRLVVLGLATWVAATGLATLLGLPGALVIGAWLALWSAVPWVGAWVGAAPFVLIGFIASNARGVIASVFAVAIVTAVGVARRRFVEVRTLHLGATATVLAFAAGTAIGGPGGLVVCVTLAALLRAWMTSEYSFRRPRDVVLTPEEPAVPLPNSGIDTIVVRTSRGWALAPGSRGALTVLAAVAFGALLWLLLGRLGAVVVWVVIGLLVAVALNRPVAWIQRRARTPRPVAIGAVALVMLGVAAGAVVLGMAGGASSSQGLSKELPTAVEGLSDLPIVGPWLEDRHAADWVSRQLENLPERLRDGQGVSEWLPTIGARLLDAFWVALLALALLVEGPRMAAAAERRVPARHRRQAIRLSAVSHAALGGYLAGAALVAGINAMVVFSIALALGITLAPVLAIWAFAWNFVPQIGGFMGGLPLVVLALAEGPVRAVIAAVLFVVYQFVENHLIQPTVISQAIDVPAWAALLTALAGGAAAGLVGAVALTPLVGVVRVILRELPRDDFPGATVDVSQRGQRRRARETDPIGT